METIPANFRAYVDQAIKKATKPLNETMATQATTIAAQAVRIRKLEQRLDSYDAKLEATESFESLADFL